MDSPRTGDGQSHMAVDAVRNRRRTLDIGFAKEPCTGPLLAVAGRVVEIPSPLFVAGRHGELSAMVARFGRSESWLVFPDEASPPALPSVNDTHRFCGHPPRGSYGPSPTRPP